MAATAGSVAAGSVLGHGISSMLFGGGGNHTAQATEAPAAAPPMQQTQSSGMTCEVQAKGECREHVTFAGLTNRNILQTSPSVSRKRIFLLANGILTSSKL